MGQLRTINHPGCEIVEIDASGSTEQVGGCTSLVVGFFPQGESATPVNPTTLKSVKSYFGTPETEAERYSYYACKSVFDNGGKLIAARIPYDNNSQYLTPAVKFNIKEWSTTHVTGYSETSVNSIVNTTEMNYASGGITNPSDFYYNTVEGEENAPYITTLTVNDKKIISEDPNSGEITETVTTTPVTVISNSGTSNPKSTKSTYYTLEFKTPFDIDGTATYHINDTETKSVAVKSYVSDFATTDNASYTSITLTVSSADNDFFCGTWTFTNVDGEGGTIQHSGTAETLNYCTIKALKDEGSANLNGKFKITQYNTASQDDFDTPVIEIENLIYQNTTIYSGMVLNSVLFSNVGGSHLKITQWDNHSWKTTGTVSASSVNGFYNESKIDDETKISDFTYDVSNVPPATAWVEKLGPTTTPITSMAIKSYWKSGEGLVYPDMTSDSFLELRIWDSTVITAISSLTENNANYYDIIETTYSGIKGAETTEVTDGFKAAPVTADVTDTEELMKIRAQENWDATTEPDVIKANNPVGTGTIKILCKYNNGTDAFITSSTDASEWRNDFYQFVSPYSSVKEVALAQSENYKWIHYTTSTELTGSGDYKNQVLMASTLGCETSAVPDALSKIENVVSIVPDEDNNGYITLTDYLDYRDEAKKVDENTIVIANITEQKFGKDPYNNTDNEEVLGIVPVLMTGFQSLPKQSRVQLPDSITNSKIFNALETIIRGSSIDVEGMSEPVTVKSVELSSDGYARTLGNSEAYDPYESTYSNTVLGKVPSIELNSSYKPNGSKTNYVTLAVCKLSVSSANDNKVALTVLESFSGSLDSSATDDKGNSVFIDTVVNNDESGSAYVKMFSNYSTTLTGSETRSMSEKRVVNPATNDSKITVVVPQSCGIDNWWSTKKRMQSLGFTEKQSKKYISYATLVASLENIYDILSNVDEEDIDIVVDAGLTSIANRIKKYIDENPDETKCEYDLTFDKINSVTDVAGWKSMAAKLITFCQTTRKDCMALIDAPRSLCVKNNAKLIDSKKTTTSKYSVDYDILPKFNYLGGLNSSYGAGFCDWILAVDDFTAKNIWMPPSIAAEGNIIYTDYNSNYWMAPAGEKRGNITWAVDIAFNPNSAQQDSIYSKGWNYAVSVGGNIMTWGQKTFLTSNSSFNRINVRRLFLRLERLVRKNSKWVIFELNNQKTRNTYLDRIDPIFANVKAMGGIENYQLICDERNNGDSVRNANEFRAAMYVIPQKASEFIILTFENLPSGAVFSEYYGDL